MSEPKIPLTLALAMLIVAAAQLVNPYETFASDCLDQTGCSLCCPECKHCCQLDAEIGDVEKKCFEVETKVICIPRVVFPWQVGKHCFPFCKKNECSSCDACNGRGCSNCVHNGAKTRKIKILKSRKYQCPQCEYAWSTVEKPCGSSCGPAGCCDSGCDSGLGGTDPTAAADAQTWQADQAITYGDTSSAGLLPIEVQHP
jgi:hypothetical protein